MKVRLSLKNVPFKEVLFQIFLNVTVFVFYSFDRRIPGIEPFKILFFLNYAIAGLVINYYLLPRYLYLRRYFHFIIYMLIVVVLLILMEELVLEKIFYPDTRGKHFFGVFYTLLSTMPSITILVGAKFAWDAIVKQQEVQELRNNVRESELQFLKSQINPHFLFNNLNNLYSHAIEQSPKTPEIILELSAVLRYILYDCKAKYVPLAKEIEQLENYINLNRMQIEGRGKVGFTAENIPSGYYVAPLILMVFVENAFKHSTSSLTENIDIYITLSVDKNGILSFSCRNTFMEQTNTERLSKGIGLANVKKRLHLLYPESHELDIFKAKGHYAVKLNMDLNKTNG